MIQKAKSETLFLVKYQMGLSSTHHNTLRDVLCHCREHLKHLATKSTRAIFQAPAQCSSPTEASIDDFTTSNLFALLGWLSIYNL